MCLKGNTFELDRLFFPAGSCQLAIIVQNLQGGKSIQRSTPSISLLSFVPPLHLPTTLMDENSENDTMFIN